MPTKKITISVHIPGPTHKKGKKKGAKKSKRHHGGPKRSKRTGRFLRG